MSYFRYRYRYRPIPGNQSFETAKVSKIKHIKTYCTFILYSMELFSVSSEPVIRKRIFESAWQSDIDSEPEEVNEEAEEVSEPALKKSFTFAELGLCDWLCQSTVYMGFRKPTEIQKACIPAILGGRDVLACAETGSGKTAAFALPILQVLSKDPYGIFALVLTPTRELAMQISEQVRAFGASFSVRVALVIGGVNLIEQSLQLSKRPHIVIATPGRMRHHLQSAQAPDISKTQFLVLDEADRLLSGGFADELDVILSKMNSKRKTLLFSATLTDSLEELEKMALSNALRFDLTKERKLPANLVQQYLFMSAKIKTCFLVSALEKQGLAPSLTTELAEKSRGSKKKSKVSAKHGGESEEDAHTATASSDMPRSAIIFVGSCQRCQEVSEILLEMGVDCAALHSLMNQTMRFASLNKFKSRATRILVATDVASRGLDIPEVDLVVNFDLPKITSDYVHRIGRTARAGRAGRSLSFITQYDVELVHAIEEFTHVKMIASTEVVEKDVIPLLNPVSKAMRLAQMKLLDSGFEEKVATVKNRKKTQRRKMLKKAKTSDHSAAPEQS
jgi:ATP-dependent RNA helicase DDX49/DBP8